MTHLPEPSTIGSHLENPLNVQRGGTVPGPGSCLFVPQGVTSMFRRLIVLGIFVLTFVAFSGNAADEGFTKLFNGKDWTGFKLQGVKEDTYKIVDETIICSGKPNGYFYTEKSYKNYHLKFEVKYARPNNLKDDASFGGNSGYLIHITGDHKVWPKCVEVQGMNRDMGNIFSIGGAPKGTFKKDAEAQKKAIKPVGEWNMMEIICKDGSITAMINGSKVAEGTSDLKEGTIGWQSEGAEIHFKNIMIKEMK
jgi:hypothetical protein